jgi:hypothetical protein
VWSRVVHDTLGVKPEEQPEQIPVVVREILRAQKEVSARRNRIRVLSAAPGRPTPLPGLERLKEATTDLLSSLLDVTGAHAVVDTSKRPEEAAIIAATGRFDHYVLHVVREPAAVVHSWRRRKAVRTAGGVGSMATRTAPKTVSQWLENAVGAEFLHRSFTPDRWLFLRYEDFVTRPKDTVQRILDFLRERAAPPFVSDHAVHLGSDHVLSGNPNRFDIGPVQIIPDREWAKHMSQAERRLIQLVTAPFLVRYGYL